MAAGKSTSLPRPNKHGRLVRAAAWTPDQVEAPRPGDGPLSTTPVSIP